MRKLTERKLEFLQNIANKIDSEKYYTFTVVQFKDGNQIMPEDYRDDVADKYIDDGIYLLPDESRWLGDRGEYMGNTFEDAKYNIGIFVNDLG